MRCRRLGAVVLVTVLAAACGDDGSHTGRAGPGTTPELTTTTETTTTTTTTTLPPGGRRPTPEDPLRVILAGDSIMADVAPAISYTLEEGGSGRARFVAAPSIPRREVQRDLWRLQLEEFDPEVVVVLVGVWEAMVEEELSGLPIGSIEREQAYRAEALVPYLDVLTSEGAEVVWIGMPPVRREPHRSIHVAMNRAVAQLARERRDLTFVPGQDLLSGPDGAWADLLPGPHGNLQRVRRLDGTHLCGDGAVRLSRPVLRHLRQQWDVPLAEGWPGGPWRWVYPPEACPDP